MKKNIKRLVAILVVMTMIVTMCSTAFAAGHGSKGKKPGRSQKTVSQEVEPSATTEAVVEEPAETTPAEDQAVEEVSETPAQEAAVEEAAVEEAAVEEAAVEETVAEDASSEETGSEDIEEAGEAVVEDAAAIENAEEEITYPAVSFDSEKVDGVIVHVDAPEGALPEGTTMDVAKVSLDAVQDAVDRADDITGTVVAAVDITFADKDGEVVEPKSDITVTMTSDEIAKVESPSVVHVDVKADEIKDADVAAEKVNDEKVTAEDDAVAFDAAKFSIYAVIKDEEIVTNQITYHFLDGEGNDFEFLNKAGETVTTQIIKDGESLQEVPAPGLIGENSFNGWYYYDKDTDTWGAEVKFDEPISVSETKDVYIKAHYGSVIYVTFYQYARDKGSDSGNVVLERRQVPLNDEGKGSIDMSSVTVPAPKTTLKFMGWSLAPGTDASETDGDEPGSRELLQNSTVTFTEDTDVYPVYYSGLWIIFVSANTGMGASYTNSYFLPADSATAAAAEPEDPRMKGYAFDGWYTEAENVTDYSTADTDFSKKFDFSTSFAELSNPDNGYLNNRGEVVLYGHWKGGETTYIVVYWKQNVNDSKTATDKNYDYAGQTDPITATTGSSPAPTAQQRQQGGTGFNYDSYKLTDSSGNEVAGIAADGTSILNIYFDRRLITLNFPDAITYTETTSNNGYQYGIIDGKYARIYYRNGVWRTAYYLGDLYTGKRYLRSNSDLSYTGLYGQTLAFNGYSWPSTSGWEYRGSNSQTYQMSYLGEFVLPANRITGANDSVTTINFRRNDDATRTIYYYIQNEDGSWPADYIDAGLTAAATIQIPEKFEGYTADAYQYNNNGNGGNYSSNTWRNAKDNGGNALTVDVNNNMAIRYRRNTYDIKYLNPIDESQVLTSRSLLYGSSLSTAKPGSGTDIDLGVPGYEWDGKWYKDKACTIEFDFNTETMPLDGTKVYAGLNPLHYYVKIDPNGGQLLTGQSTWRWVTYGDDTTYTYDNIERNYIEYKGTGTPYYYYYDEFDTSKRDEIWNYEYMATNPRTAYYTDKTAPNDWEDSQHNPHSGSEAQAWLDTNTKYSYEADAYALIGWYDITDGVENMTPFKSGTPITKDTIIQAQWRRTGEYRVNYSVEAVDENGEPLMAKDGVTRVTGANSPSDSAKYADQSDSSIMDKIGMVPTGYSFVGWYYDGKVYQPGDVFQVLAKLSDENKIIHIYPVMEPVETLPVEVIDITFDPNGGEFTSTADTELNAIITDVTTGEPGSYAPELVNNEDGTKTIQKLKINESFELPDAEAVENGVEVNGEKVIGRGYKLKEWNTKADGTGTSFALDTKIGIDNKDPLPNTLYAIWEKVFYVYHPATGKFQTIVTGNTTDRWALTTGFDPDGTVNKTQYTSYYYGGFAVYAAGNADAAGLTFEGGEVKSGTIADNYWTRTRAAKSADLWNVNDVGAVYYLKEVPTSYLAKPVAVAIRDNYGNGNITSLHFLSVTDTNIYRAGGIKLKGVDTKGTFAKNFKLTQNNGDTTTITANSQFTLDGYLTVVNGGKQDGEYPACQAYWTTYDYVNVYGIEANIKDITLE